jgi:hypothetical protein
VVLRLATLRLWQEPSRLQAIPRFLQDVEPERVYANMADLARRAGGRRMIDDRHVKEEGITRNLGDWQRNAQGEWIWRGIGLLRQRNGGYVLAPSGLAVRSEYGEDPQGTAWKVMLAAEILTHEPRTRAVVRALSAEGAEWRFRASAWFRGQYDDAVLTGDLGEYRPLAPASRGRPNIQSLLNDLGAWALGGWRAAALGAASTAPAVAFAGVRDPVLTVDDLGGALHGPFELFAALGVAEDVDGTVRWRAAEAAARFGPELAADFGWAAGPVATDDVLALVGRLVRELRADDGFVVAARLRDGLAAAGVAEPDREVAALVDAGFVVIDAFDYGQRRHGEGLFGDPRKQLVRLRVRGAGQDGSG